MSYNLDLDYFIWIPKAKIACWENPESLHCLAFTWLNLHMNHTLSFAACQNCYTSSAFLTARNIILNYSKNEYELEK